MPLMSFQKIRPIDNGQLYLENALKKALKKVSAKTYKGTPIEKLKKKEVDRISYVRDALVNYLCKIDESFPNLDALPEFYIKLIEETLDFDTFKKALGSIKFAKDTTKRITTENIRKIRMQEAPESIKRIVGGHLGRISSVLRQIQKNLTFLELSRKTLRNFPTLDPEAFTVAIAGFPNVGKSTLLSKLTTATPEIKNYSFTTKGLNVGIFEYRFHPIQLVDTPGALGRAKENVIERLATITRRYLAKLVVYVFDPTEQYPLSDQEKLLDDIKDEDHEIILYLSKTDIVDKERTKKYTERFLGIIADPEKLRKAITKFYKDEWM